MEILHYFIFEKRLFSFTLNISYKTQSLQMILEVLVEQLWFYELYYDAFDYYNSRWFVFGEFLTIVVSMHTDIRCNFPSPNSL